MKKLRILALISCTVIMLSACSGGKNGKDNNKNKPGYTSFSSDLEATSWMNQNTLTRELAHSGKFSSRVDSLAQYSFGFVNSFMNISDTLPEKVDVDFWLFYPQTGIKSNLVISIDSVEKNIFWAGIDLKDSVTTPNQWKEIKATVKLPTNIMPTDKIKVYVLNNDKRALYIDDLTVTFGKKD